MLGVSVVALLAVQRVYHAAVLLPRCAAAHARANAGPSHPNTAAHARPDTFADAGADAGSNASANACADACTHTRPDATANARADSGADTGTNPAG